MRRRLSRHRGWRATKIALVVLFSILFVPVLIGLIGVGVECGVFGGEPQRPDTPTGAATVPAELQLIRADLKDYERREDQTYLTLPEWYIVYSAEEYAALVENRPPSSFPYFGAVEQFWGTYYDVCAVTREQYTFNSGYHLTLVVIGASFTIENIVRGLYEGTIGRITEWLSDGGQTEEDAYARAVAHDYGAFLHTTPWYKFPFAAKLRGLWAETGLWGPNIVRKWERKVALSLEYGTKAAYGWLIEQATPTTYSDEELKIYVHARGISDEIVQRVPPAEIVQDLGAQGAIVALRRFEAFTQDVPELAAQGVEFVEVAGNDEILITAIAPRDWRYDLADGEVLFEMPILTRSEQVRLAVNVPVAALHRVLAELDRQAVSLEHIYDY